MQKQIKTCGWASYDSVGPILLYFIVFFFGCLEEEIRFTHESWLKSCLYFIDRKHQVCYLLASVYLPAEVTDYCFEKSNGMTLLRKACFHCQKKKRKENGLLLELFSTIRHIGQIVLTTIFFIDQSAYVSFSFPGKFSMSNHVSLSSFMCLSVCCSFIQSFTRVPTCLSVSMSALCLSCVSLCVSIVCPYLDGEWKGNLSGSTHV